MSQLQLYMAETTTGCVQTRTEIIQIEQEQDRANTTLSAPLFPTLLGRSGSIAKSCIRLLTTTTTPPSPPTPAPKPKPKPQDLRTMHWSVKPITTPSLDTSLSLLISFDHAKYIVNCGEATQRAFTQRGVGWKKVVGVFLTSGRKNACGGLPGT